MWAGNTLVMQVQASGQEGCDDVDVFVCDEPFVLARRSLLLVLVAAAVHVATIRPQAQRWPRFPLLDLFLLDWVPLSRLALGQWETRHRLRMWIRILHTHQMGPW